jgi:hypothetical protein
VSGHCHRDLFRNARQAGSVIATKSSGTRLTTELLFCVIGLALVSEILRRSSIWRPELFASPPGRRWVRT